MACKQHGSLTHLAAGGLIQRGTGGGGGLPQVVVVAVVMGPIRPYLLPVVLS